jgi:SOS-response transcriptional repressor LexA
MEQLRTNKGAMSDEAQNAVRQWIQAILDERGWTAGRLAKAANVAPSTISRALNPEYEFTPSTKTLAKIAAAVNRVAPEIASEGLDRARAIGRRIPVMGEVRAGAWFEIDQEPQPVDWVYFDDPEFERAKVWALRVVGSSMNRHYPDGTTVIVADAQETGIQEGDHVVVRRIRGSSAETTLKEVVIDPEGVALWPRSTDPAHQEPIRIPARREGAQDGVEIIAVVVADYRKRSRRPGRVVGL